MISEHSKSAVSVVAEQLKSVSSDTRSYISGMLDGLKRADEMKAESANEE